MVRRVEWVYKGLNLQKEYERSLVKLDRKYLTKEDIKDAKKHNREHEYKIENRLISIFGNKIEDYCLIIYSDALPLNNWLEISLNKSHFLKESFEEIWLKEWDKFSE